MKLKTLDNFNEIVIQMHDNPDADAIGAGYAMYRYFQSKGKKVRLVYGGTFRITKSNMNILIKQLQIPVEYVEELNNPELLLCVDCQYGEGNVTKFDAQNVAMIDHHDTGRLSDDMAEIRSHIVSCSTICYDMLKKEGYDVNADKGIATALYYGLYMDSNSFSELRHPIERDMIDNLDIDKALIKKLKHSNFTLAELETAGIALIRYSYDEAQRLTIIKAKPCDPNILGVIGDLILQVDSIDVSVIYNECPDGFKVSIRSCITEVSANDLAIFLTENIGNGGGHGEKAGAYISLEKYRQVYGTMGIESYFFERMNLYYKQFEVVYAKNGLRDYSGFEQFRKKNLCYGVINPMDVFPEGTKCKVRSMEGDVYIKAKEKNLIMVGYYGEVYPIERSVFEARYELTGNPYSGRMEYDPSARNMFTDEIVDLKPYIQECKFVGEARIFAKKIEKPTKIFTKWDYERYMVGSVGDWIGYREDDNKDIYIIRNEVFEETYEKV